MSLVLCTFTDYIYDNAVIIITLVIIIMLSLLLFNNKYAVNDWRIENGINNDVSFIFSKTSEYTNKVGIIT